MAKTKGQNYMHGAAILTVGVVIMKILGFIYKIPLGNMEKPSSPRIFPSGIL